MRVQLIATTPAAVRRLTNEATVRALACLPPEVAAANVEMLIDAATAAIVRHLNIPATQNGSATLGVETLNETWRFRPGQRSVRNLPLARRPVIDLIGVAVNGVRNDRLIGGSDAVMTAAAAALTSALGPNGAGFNQSHAGRSITVVGAGSGGGALEATIASVVDATTVMLSAAAQTSVAGAVYTVENPSFAYSVRAENGLITNIAGDGSATAWSGAAIEVDYRAGYTLPGTAAPTLPKDIEFACVLLVKRLLQRVDEQTHAPVKSESFTGVGAWTFGDTEIAWEGGLPVDVRDLLAPHRYHVV